MHYMRQAVLLAFALAAAGCGGGPAAADQARQIQALESEMGALRAQVQTQADEIALLRRQIEGLTAAQIGSQQRLDALETPAGEAMAEWLRERMPSEQEMDELLRRFGEELEGVLPKRPPAAPDGSPQ